MSEYRRYFVPGGTYFFTVVTENRWRLFEQESARRLLGAVMRECAVRFPWSTVAIVLLPDHLHALWTLPPGDDRYSLRWRWIKREFTRGWLALGGSEEQRSRSRQREQRRGVWQRRFWEHTIQDDADLENHADYIHYNPVKHGLAQQPNDWPWSSFRRWVQTGHYGANWAATGSGLLVPGNAGE
jgi:putative transposase